MNPLTSALDRDARELIPELEAVYEDLHRHPELSMQEVRTARIAATEKVARAFEAEFGERAYETPPAGASEDFSVFGRTWNVPYVFWFVGGTDPETYARAKEEKRINELPSNHSPNYAPVLDPTMKAGLEAMLTAAAAWLCEEGQKE